MSKIRLNLRKVIAIAICLAGVAIFSGCSKGEDEPDGNGNQSSYTVTFDSNGGTAVQSQTVERDCTITTPVNPTRQGYTFVFWHLKDATTAYDFDTPINSNITLIAKWSEIPSVVKAEWYSGGSIVALFNPLRAVYYIKWQAISGANSYALYKSSSATGSRTLVQETSNLSIDGAIEVLTTAGTHIRYYWVVTTINGVETARPANGGIKVTYTVTLSSRVWMPNGTPPMYGYWMTIGVDGITRNVEQNPIK